MTDHSKLFLFGTQLGCRLLVCGLWVAEHLASQQRRERLSQARRRFQSVNARAAELARQAERGDVDATLHSMEKVLDEMGETESLTPVRELRRSMRVRREEVDALCAIRERAGGAVENEIAGYREYLEGHPESRAAHQFLAGALGRSGEFAESLELHRSEIRLSKSTLESEFSQLSVAKGLAGAGQYPEAIAELETLIGSSSERFILCLAHFELGNVLERMGDPQAARAAWKQSMRLDSTGKIRKQLRERRKSV